MNPLWLWGGLATLMVNATLAAQASEALNFELSQRATSPPALPLDAGGIPSATAPGFLDDPGSSPALSFFHRPLPSPAPAAPNPQPDPEVAVAPFTPIWNGRPWDGSIDSLFAGEAESLVARTVGAAEGTRTPAGARTSAYYGHIDPGNGVWNLGSFSYQHGAASPAEADRKQLKRLRQQAQVIESKAAVAGLHLSLEAWLNGIDLVNQAPLAVIDREGYVEWLARAYGRGMAGSEAVVWARVQSFRDPKTQRWNAPGLGNTAEGIWWDQQRRWEAIDRTWRWVQQEP